MTNADISGAQVNQQPATAGKLRSCRELKHALEGNIGDIVAAHEEMILHYYHDVQVQARQSFNAAKKVALIGFGVLIATLAYTLLFDALSQVKVLSALPIQDKITVGSIGVISGVLIEFIASVNFWLYGRASRQFSAFHICLERTHRYLIAYKVADNIESKKDEILGKLVCIMANAPMITRQDIDSLGNGHLSVQGTQIKAVSSGVERG